MTSTKDFYCFSDMRDVSQLGNAYSQLKILNQSNVFLNNCPPNSINVCFTSGNSNCNIVVDYSLGIIRKGDDIIHFEGDALMYAGIFSSVEIYECQVERLMKRTSELALLYNDKATLVKEAKCNSNLELLGLSNLVSNIESSSELSFIIDVVDDIGNKNDVADCRLW